MGKIDRIWQFLNRYSGDIELLNLKFTEYEIFKPRINGCRILKFHPFPNGASLLYTTNEIYVDAHAT